MHIKIVAFVVCWVKHRVDDMVGRDYDVADASNILACVFLDRFGRFGAGGTAFTYQHEHDENSFNTVVRGPVQKPRFPGRRFVCHPSVCGFVFVDLC